MERQSPTRRFSHFAKRSRTRDGTAHHNRWCTHKRRPQSAKLIFRSISARRKKFMRSQAVPSGPKRSQAVRPARLCRPRGPTRRSAFLVAAKLPDDFTPGASRRAPHSDSIVKERIAAAIHAAVSSGASSRPPSPTFQFSTTLRSMSTLKAKKHPSGCHQFWLQGILTCRAIVPPRRGTGRRRTTPTESRHSAERLPRFIT